MAITQTVTYTDYTPELEALLRSHFGGSGVVAAQIRTIHEYEITIAVEDAEHWNLRDFIEREYAMLRDAPKGIGIDIHFVHSVPSGDVIDLRSER